MRFWREANPRSKGHGSLFSSDFVGQHGRPAVREMLRQLAYKLPAHQTCELMIPLGLFNQTLEHLHRVEVVPAELLGQRDQ